MPPHLMQGLQDGNEGDFNVVGGEILATFSPWASWMYAGNSFGNSSPVIFPSLASTGGTSVSGQTDPGPVVAVTSGGITFNLIFDAAAMAAPASFRAGIEQAAAILAASIFDKITVNIKIDYSGVGGGAAAGPDGGLFENYSLVKADLANNATPGDTTFNALPAGTSIQGQSSVAVWNAQLKLWGLMGANDTTTDDGSATFATDINPNLLVGVALHELTHALGRIPYGPQPDVFDLFRFTSAGTRLFSGGATAPAAYFSVDGGVTKIADFGKTSDASDFLNSGVQGPNDPFNEFYTGNTLQQLTAADLKQMDALGFHISAPDIQAPSLISDHPLSILSGATQTVSSSLLSANDNVSSAAQLHYIITTGPSDGTLLLSGSATSSFTQADINNGLVSYHETTGFVTSDSFLFTVTDAASNVTGTSSFQINIEPVYSGNRSDYQMSYDNVAQSFTVADQRQGSPDGTHTLNHGAQFQFADGVSTYSYDTNGALVSETFNNTNGTHWVNTFDTVGNQAWVWSITLYDTQGSITSQSGLNHDSTHWLTLNDVNNQYSWTTATIHFDANWDVTSITGTNDNGSHSLTMQDVAAAYDTATWSSAPFDTILNQAAGVATASGNEALTAQPGSNPAATGGNADGFVFNLGSANSVSGSATQFAEGTSQISPIDFGHAPAAGAAPLVTVAPAGSDRYSTYDNAHAFGWDSNIDASAIAKHSAFHMSEFMLA
jgi:YD repeat-containing protein